MTVETSQPFLGGGGGSPAASESVELKVAMAEEEAPPPRRPWYHLLARLVLKIWDLVCEHWFILGLGFAIGFAAAVPDFGRNDGWIEAQYTIKYGAVIIIFLLSGMGLKTRVLMNAATRVHFHLLIQSVSLVITPAIGYGLASALGTSSINHDLVKGLVVAMAMPTTISTNVVFTKQAGGNEATALINAVIGNIIGIFVSPAWLYLYLGKSSQAPYVEVIRQLAVTIIAPLIVGQLFQYWKPEWVKKAQETVNFGRIGNVMILLLVWNTFCNTFYKDIKLGAASWVPMFLLEIGIYLLFTVMCLAIGTFVYIQRLFSIDKPDAVALTFCGATKTLALGMPLISALYGKQSNAGIISLPLIIYHAEQCLLGSLLIPHLKKWVTGPASGIWPASLRPPPPPVVSDEPAQGTGAASLVNGPSSDKPAAGKGNDAGHVGPEAVVIDGSHHSTPSCAAADGTKPQQAGSQ